MAAEQQAVETLEAPVIFEAWRVMKLRTALAREQVGVATPVVLADDAVFFLHAADLATAPQLTRSRCTVGFRARRSRARDGHERWTVHADQPLEYRDDC